MAAKLDEIRKAADRVAASLELDVVDVEFTGTAKNRTLCIYLEKNAAGRFLTSLPNARNWFRMA